MNPDGYQIRRVNTATPSPGGEPMVAVDPFPAKRWTEPLPTTGGIPLDIHGEGASKRALARFYPPLLTLSMALTGVFCYLYITKPVVVENGEGSAAPVASAVVHLPATPGGVGANEEVEESGLAPFPEGAALPGDEVETIDTRRLPVPVVNRSLEPTNLRMQHIFMADTGAEQMERLELELPVLYECRTLSWDAESIEEARYLALQMSEHLKDVQIVRKNGEALMAQWKELLKRTMPTDVLRADSPSLPENQQGLNPTGDRVAEHLEP